ncbi:MAG TPA: class I SAM-dependent methyltransferase [Devosia sp.]
MSEAQRHDSWQAGESYEAYMGRWSRKVAPRFLSWIGADNDLDWLDLGSGTGALTGAILATQSPSSVVGVEPSPGFVAHASETQPDHRASFIVGTAEELPLADATRDVAVSGLVLNFVPDRARALREMIRVVRPGGTVAFYVWDYPGGGVEFMRMFWRSAIELDPAAADLAEDKRFPFCTPEQLIAMADDAGLASVECAPIEVPTIFQSFEDYWHPFTLGAGPAPGYCSALPADAREKLRARLEASLPRGDGGTIPLNARAWTLRGTAPQAG